MIGNIKKEISNMPAVKEKMSCMETLQNVMNKECNRAKEFYNKEYEEISKEIKEMKQYDEEVREENNTSIKRQQIKKRGLLELYLTNQVDENDIDYVAKDIKKTQIEKSQEKITEEEIK